jgi:hypothetical protein
VPRRRPLRSGGCLTAGQCRKGLIMIGRNLG